VDAAEPGVRTNAPVATLPLAFTAERRYRSADGRWGTTFRRSSAGNWPDTPERQYRWMDKTMAHRVLHIRHPDGLSEEMYLRFLAGCRLFEAYVKAVLSEWGRLPDAGPERVVGEYIFGAPRLSADRGVASLPIDGEGTLGSRAAFENASSYLLSAFFPSEFKQLVEEGLTESTGDGRTYWRQPAELLSRALAAARPFGSQSLL
jgi:hypothetical protein